MNVELKDAIKKPSRNSLKKQKRREEQCKQFSDVGHLLKAMNDIIRLNQEGTIPKQSLRVLRAQPPPQTLLKVNEPRIPGPVTSDPRTWEVIRSIVDSGASISALKPGSAKAYALQESEASKAGVEYETAGGDTVPDLG